MNPLSQFRHLVACISVQKVVCGAFLILVLLATSQPGRASDMNLWHGEGAFVEKTAVGGGWLVAAPFYGVGYVAGLPFGKRTEAAEYMAGLPLITGMAATGAPAFILKKVFYDAPKAVAGSFSQPTPKDAAAKP